MNCILQPVIVIMHGTMASRTARAQLFTRKVQDQERRLYEEIIQLLNYRHTRMIKAQRDKCLSLGQLWGSKNPTVHLAVNHATSLLHYHRFISQLTKTSILQPSPPSRNHSIRFSTSCDDIVLIHRKYI